METGRKRDWCFFKCFFLFLLLVVSYKLFLFTSWSLVSVELDSPPLVEDKREDFICFDVIILLLLQLYVVFLLLLPISVVITSSLSDSS